MTPEQFCYWLQGYAELHQQTPTSAQWVAIMAHLNTVFNKVTPIVPGPGVTGPVPRPNPFPTQTMPQIIC